MCGYSQDVSLQSLKISVPKETQRKNKKYISNMNIVMERQKPFFLFLRVYFKFGSENSKKIGSGNSR
jgi:hypothetical protein